MIFIRQQHKQTSSIFQQKCKSSSGMEVHICCFVMFLTTVFHYGFMADVEKSSRVLDSS